jgi:site-specific recombinase XerD
MNNTYPPSIKLFKQYVELRDYRRATKDHYVRYLWKLAEHFDCDPATLTEKQVQEYFLFLRQELQCSPSVMKGCKWALRCFYRECLKVTGWTVFEDLRIAVPKTLPVVLDREQVQKLLATVREPRFAVCLRLIYYCGLRIGEAVRLAVKDFGQHHGSPHLHIRDGKGGKDRYVPVPEGMLQELRAFWRTHRNPTLIFPAPPRAGGPVIPLALSRTTQPMSTASVQEVFRLARQASGSHPDASTHTLRHSYATHLLEEGVSVRQIGSYLGHESLDTTAIYVHLTAVSEARTQAALAVLYQPPKA